MTLQEKCELKQAEKAYKDSVRNMDIKTILHIQKHPWKEDGDSVLVAHAKAAYSHLQSFGHGVIDMRPQLQPL